VEITTAVESGESPHEAGLTAKKKTELSFSLCQTPLVPFLLLSG